jgi:disulfide oxidoreductase YuzD
MSNPSTFSRAYLQSIPEQKKQDLLGVIMSQFHISLVNIAAEGKTSYMVEEHVWRNKCRMVVRHPAPPEFKDWELIAAIEKKYPDCKVTYEEMWVDVGISNRTLKKGIVIDWS